jgi:ATP-dependent Clp protease adaptor protein ClpS
MKGRSQNRPYPHENFEKEISGLHRLVLYNDEINSFDFVIESLIEVCDHTEIQAEQCTIIAHHKGKCEVRTGKQDTLREMQIGLIRKGLKASIE